MSEAVIRKKLANAYNKAGRILGREFDVYRPVALNDSLSVSNFIKKMYSSFTLSKNMVSPQPEGFKQYIVYSDINGLEKGDIFSDSGETFVIVWNRGLEDTIAIRTSDLVEIHRGTWTTTNGLTPTLERIAKNVPATVTKATSTSDVRIGNVANPGQALRYEVRIYSPTAEIKQTDNIIFADGTILHIDETSLTEYCQLFICSEVKK